MAKPKRIVPPPGKPTAINTYEIPVDTVLHRVHKGTYAPDQFNPGFGNARFSPFIGPDGKAVSTLYAAATQQGAMMETIFHDVSLNPDAKTYAQRKLESQVHSVLATTQPLHVADLSSTGLIKMGLTRAHLIDTEADQYPVTQAWAQTLHAENPGIVGLSWVSRQDDTCRAYVFFGDRMPDNIFQTRAAPTPLLAGDTATLEVLELAQTLGVDIVK